ncbi:MAG: outer membrane protein assembly factor BamE [Pacificimonas sp.]
MTKNKTSIMILMAAGAALTLTSGCQRLRAHQGYVGEPEIIGSIAAGVDNKESVEKTLGRPTFTSQWNDDIWYYVARNTEQLAFLAPDPTSQEVLMVSFDATGNVTTVERDQTLDQVASFDPSGDKTPVFGRDTTLFEDIFGNIGRVSSIPTGGPPQ